MTTTDQESPDAARRIAAARAQARDILSGCVVHTVAERLQRIAPELPLLARSIAALARLDPHAPGTPETDDHGGQPWTGHVADGLAISMNQPMNHVRITPTTGRPLRIQMRAMDAPLATGMLPESFPDRIAGLIAIAAQAVEKAEHDHADQTMLAAANHQLTGRRELVAPSPWRPGNAHPAITHRVRRQLDLRTFTRPSGPIIALCPNVVLPPQRVDALALIRLMNELGVDAAEHRPKDDRP